MTFFFLKQENMLMTLQQIKQGGILHSKHKIHMKWTLLMGDVVGNVGVVEIMSQKTS